jgi:mono/diheme cytochrome c family protein
MSRFLKVVAFGLVVIAFFAGFANFGVPQVEPAPPPKEEKLALGAMSTGDFVALGKRVFEGKGTCTLCHNPVGGRAPLLDRVAAVAAERLKDARYKGSAKSSEEYLYESLVKPSAYVVAGFGKAGTNDAESPMPEVSGGSIRLSEPELRAVVAYMQDASGVEVTVKIPADAGEAPKAEDKPAQRPPAKDAQEVIAQFGCTACHKIGAMAGGPIGPDLSKVGAGRDAAYLRRAILEPNADVAKGFQPNVMPAVYGEQLYAKELELLVAYLAALK